MAPPALTTTLWERIQPIYGRILAHPFVTGLTDGTLDRSAFRFYIVQDAHYLRDYARALGLLGARAPEEEQILLFCQHAVGAIEVERQLHEGFFQEFGLTTADVERTPVAPTNLAYTSYLLRIAHGGSWPEALGAVLPCYWIYWEVGKALLEQGSPDPLYQRWIEAYAGEDFGEVVAAVLRVTDQVGERIAEADRRRMSDHFETTSRYEWMFWDMGYRQETWPVP
jgi:thiaminase (transcriptional activator TenA)